MRLRAELEPGPRVQPRLPAWCLPSLILGLAIAIGLAPLGMAMGVVLLCAGPHNWCEARYFMSRMPRRWGPLRTYFLTAGGGVALLTAGFVALAVWSRPATGIAPDTLAVALATWHSAVIAWIAALVAMRRQAGARRDASWLPTVALLAIAAAWLAPTWASVALVYTHPLLALVFLDRELATRRAPWHGRYRDALTLLPVAIVGLWLLLPPGSEAAARTPESMQAGSFLLPATLATPLLATHVFLETLHYGVWIIGMPLATSAVPWHVRAVPLAAPSSPWREVVRTTLMVGGLAVLALWILFAIDYETTRQVYFTVAVAHVLAEVPFLIRSL